MTLESLAWWLVAQMEIDFNRRQYPGQTVLPNITLKHWAKSTEGAPLHG